MINISAMIGKVKSKVDSIKQANANKKANQLMALRQERVKLEGRERIHSLHAKEQMRVNQAKDNLKKYSTINKIKVAVSKANAKAKKFKSNNKTKKDNSKRDYFGGSGGKNVFD